MNGRRFWSAMASRSTRIDFSRPCRDLSSWDALTRHLRVAPSAACRAILTRRCRGWETQDKGVMNLANPAFEAPATNG